MADDIEIQRVLVVGTAHMTRSDSRLLEGGGYSRTYLKWEHGYWIWIPSGQNSAADFADVRADALMAGMSEAFVSMLAKARDHGVEWLRFDSDGPTLDGQPTFNW